MIQTAVFFALLVFLIVKFIGHLRKKSRKPKSAEQELRDTMREARDSLSVELMESVAGGRARAGGHEFSW